MSKRPPLILPLDDGRYVLEIETEFTVQVSRNPEIDEREQAVKDSPEGTSFIEMANMAGFDLTKDLAGGDWSDIDFRDDSALNGVNFRNARLWRTKFGPANTLLGTLLEGADLRGAEGLTVEMLAQAHIDYRTQLPDYIDRDAVNRLHAQLNISVPKQGDPERDGFIRISVPATLHKTQ